MRNADKFLAKHQGSIISTLGCFDRLIFKGYLPFGGNDHLNKFVDRLNIRRKDFLPLVEPMSERLVQHAQTMCEKAQAPYHYVQGKQAIQGATHRSNHSRAKNRNRSGRCSLRAGNMSHGKTPLRPAAATTGVRVSSPTRAVLLFSRQGIRPRTCTHSNLVSLHRANLRERPRLARSPNAAPKTRLHAVR